MLNAQLQVSKFLLRFIPSSIKERSSYCITLANTQIIQTHCVPSIQQSGYTNAVAARQFQAQRQRSMQSPGAQTLRQNSFTDSGFQEPPSPTTQNTYAPNMFNTQQMRMARQQSIPNATQHLPGK